MTSGSAVCTAVLLAAGRSTRFGSDKLMHPLADGRPVALASLTALRHAVKRVVAVVGEHNSELRAMLEAGGAEIVEVTSGENAGMGTSLAAGIAAAPDAPACLVALADMPFIRTQTIASVRDALDAGAQIVAPVFEGRRGHPVGFAARFRDELLCLTGDAGARQLLEKYRNEMHLVECDDQGIIVDIDHPVDLARIVKFA